MRQSADMVAARQYHRRQGVTLDRDGHAALTPECRQRRVDGPAEAAPSRRDQQMIERAKLVQREGLTSSGMTDALGRHEAVVKQRSAHKPTRTILDRADEQVEPALLKIHEDAALVRENERQSDMRRLGFHERD